jgi:hypothetical protein
MLNVCGQRYGGWRAFVIGIAIIILDIIHRSVFYFKHYVTEPGVCFRLQVQPSQRLRQRQGLSVVPT